MKLKIDMKTLKLIILCSPGKKIAKSIPNREYSIKYLFHTFKPTYTDLWWLVNCKFRRLTGLSVNHPLRQKLREYLIEVGATSDNFQHRYAIVPPEVQKSFLKIIEKEEENVR